MYCNTTNCMKTMACDAAVLYGKTILYGATINPSKMTLALQPTPSDVKIDPAVHMEMALPGWA